MRVYAGIDAVFGRVFFRGLYIGRYPNDEYIPSGKECKYCATGSASQMCNVMDDMQSVSVNPMPLNRPV